MGEGIGRRGLRKLVCGRQGAPKRQNQSDRSELVDNQGAELDIGGKLVELILGSQDWIHRRVEGLEILPNGDSLRRQSVDFTLPQDLAISGSKGRVLLPISLMKKGPLSKFSATGPDDRSIAVLETAQNGRLAVEMLLTLASYSYGYAVPSEPPEARELLERIVLDSSADSSLVLAELDSVLSRAADISSSNEELSAVFRAIAAQFCRFFLLVFEVSD